MFGQVVIGRMIEEGDMSLIKRGVKFGMHLKNGKRSGGGGGE